MAESPQSGVKVACPAMREMRRSDMYFVYILESNNSNRHYIGCSDNVERRLSEHNKGKVSSTKAFVPWKVVYTEVFVNKSQAFSREKEIKSYKSGFKFKELQKSERWQSG